MNYVNYRTYTILHLHLLYMGITICIHIDTSPTKQDGLIKILRLEF